MSDTAKTRLAPDYFPLRPGLKWTYRHTSTEFEGVETVEVVIDRVRTSGRETRARATLTRTRKGRLVKSLSYGIRKTPDEVFSEGGVLGLARKEFPLPAAMGSTWMEAPDRHVIASLDAAIDVPCGAYSGCLRVDTFMAEGDAGSATRYYAPGLGYVCEEYAGEAWSSRAQLESFSSPEAT
ncbi:MAG: hypothetical protein ABII00_16885 [Elusimicrobiota bacterium]